MSICFTVAPVVEATMSMVLEGDTPAETYSVEVECDIRPSSTADYCEVIARNDDSTVSGNVYTLYLQGIQVYAVLTVCTCVYNH